MVTYQSIVTVGAGGIFAVNGVADVGSLALAATARADVSGSLRLRTADLADVAADIRDGRITSSAALSDPTHARGVGIAANDDASVLIKYTYFGDANLDGAIALDDFDDFVAGYRGSVAPAWTSGDFDYNGAVDAGDFSLLVNGFAGQGYSPDLFAAVSDFARTEGLNVDLSAVPEPVLLGAIAPVLFALRRIRRTRQ